MHGMMQSSRTKLASVGLLICLFIFTWSSFHDQRDVSWSLPIWQSQEVQKEKTELLAEKQRLEYALERAHRKLAEAQEAADAIAADAQDEETSAQAATADDQEHGYAYVFYATADAYACSVLVNIHRLRNILNATYPIHVLASSDVSSTYRSAFESANASVHIERAPPLNEAFPGVQGGYYQDCMLKLLAFKMQTLEPSLTRVLAFDSDQLIMKNLDHLFTGLPDVDLAAPRAYWLAKDFLASTFLMINLSDRLWKTVEGALDTVGYNKFDMDLINDLLGDSVMMLSGEYVTLNSHWEDWNLPRWYHPFAKVNMTTVEMINKLAQPGFGAKKRQDAGSGSEEASSVQDAKVASASSPETTSAMPWPPVSQPKLPQQQQVSKLAFYARPSLHPQSIPQPQPPSPKPRFPPTHPLTQELYRLQDAASVIHFTAQGKPWMKEASAVQAFRPDAHPLLAEQFALWRETAKEVCPGGLPRA